MTLAERIFNCFKQRESFTLNDAYQVNSGKPHETIRARIYDNLGIRFERIAKGIYKTLDSEETCILLEGDGRDLSMLANNSIDCIFTDHPWLERNLHAQVVMADESGCQSTWIELHLLAQ